MNPLLHYPNSCGSLQRPSANLPHGTILTLSLFAILDSRQDPCPSGNFSGTRNFLIFKIVLLCCFLLQQVGTSSCGQIATSREKRSERQRPKKRGYITRILMQTLWQEMACSADITRVLMQTLWQEMACSADITRIPIPLQNQSSQSHKQRRQSQHVAQPYLPSRALTANLGA